MRDGPVIAKESIEAGADASDGAAAYECTAASGTCGVLPARWPVGTERGLPEWFVSHARKLAIAARAAGR